MVKLIEDDHDSETSQNFGFTQINSIVFPLLYKDDKEISIPFDAIRSFEDFDQRNYLVL